MKKELNDYVHILYKSEQISKVQKNEKVPYPTHTLCVTTSGMINEYKKAKFTI